MPERIDAKGRALVPLDERALEALVPQLEREGERRFGVNPARNDKMPEFAVGLTPE